MKVPVITSGANKTVEKRVRKIQYSDTYKDFDDDWETDPSLIDRQSARRDEWERKILEQDGTQ